MTNWHLKNFLIFHYIKNFYLNKFVFFFVLKAKFKSATNFFSNLDYGKKDSKKKCDEAWSSQTKQISNEKKLSKKSNHLQQKSSTSIYMFSGISKPLIKMNSKLKFRSKSSTQLVQQISSVNMNTVADSLENPERNKLESIESKDESESDKCESKRKTSVLHGYYANNYQMYHNLNSHSRNQKRYSNTNSDAYSSLNQNSNVKSLAANL